MRAKAEGSHQQQLSGGYTQFDKNYQEWLNRSIPVLRKDTEATVKYSYVPQNAADRALPANYSVLALEYRAAFDTTKTGLGALPVNGFIKFIGSGQEYPTLFKDRSSNQSSIASQIPVTSAIRWDKNPETNQNWTVADLANIELGFSI